MAKWSALKIGVTAALCAAGVTGGYFVAKNFIWYHNYCKLIPYEVKSVKDSDLTDKDNFVLTAHRGFRAVAPENTLPAYEEAGKAGYWGAECDIYRTIDGVWVLQHDPLTYRMMNGVRVLELSTLSQLQKLNYNNGHNVADYPDLKICTLEEFFATCAKYNMHAVVEIKYNRNRSHYDEIIALQEKYGVDADYICFSFEDLPDLRKLTDAKLFLLVDEITDEDIEKAKELLTQAGYADGLEFTIDVPSNYEAHVQTAEVVAEQLKDAGINAKINLIEWNSWLSDVYADRKYQATVCGITSDMTPSYLLVRFQTDSSKNFINFASKEYDETYQKASASLKMDEKTELYKQAKQILEENKRERHIRGGLATKHKYESRQKLLSHRR